MLNSNRGDVGCIPFETTVSRSKWTRGNPSLMVLEVSTRSSGIALRLEAAPRGIGRGV